MNRNIKRKSALSVGGALLALVLCGSARADVVTEWNQRAQQALLTANTSAPASSRALAIVQVAVFDAVNGIERRYTPIHVDFEAPPGASRRAAAVQAAYATLVKLFPSQQATLAAARESSLAAIASDDAAENSQSIARGVEWGQQVADDILLWRSTDGFTPAPPPFFGGTNVGQWRPTPPGFLPGAGVQFAHMTPWALNSPAQFRPSGPPALTSDQYAADFAEVKMIGDKFSSTRNADQTEIAFFWTSNTPVAWNRIANSVADERHTTLSGNARLLALLNVAMADAVISCWEAKYTDVFWRPITAIRLASTDGNPATAEDANWTPLLTTPNFPEYPSGHATVSPAAATVLSTYFGNDAEFTLTSETLPGVVRAYTSFTQAVDEAFDARIYGGIHFRAACRDGRTLGTQVGNFVTANVARSVRGKRKGQTSHDHPRGEIGGDGESPGDNR
ncbi:MAG: vanadium-dependent haloperoxidase [Pyrinomonadaceae bacterium]